MDKLVREVLCGINPIREAFHAGQRQIERLWVAERKGGGRMSELLTLASRRGVKVETVSHRSLTEAAGTSTHQGIVAFLVTTSILTLEEMVARIGAQRPVPPLVVLDGIKDPRNCGAIIRSAAAFGIGGIVVPRRRAVGMTATVAKAAAGGLEYVMVAEVTNVTQAIQRLKQIGFWIVGADERGQAHCDTYAFPSPLVLVFGEEGRGVGPLVKRHCDALVRIPLRGPLQSLNVAVAAGILFYEVMRAQGGPDGASIDLSPQTSP